MHKVSSYGVIACRMYIWRLDSTKFPPVHVHKITYIHSLGALPSQLNGVGWLQNGVQNHRQVTKALYISVLCCERQDHIGDVPRPKIPRTGKAKNVYLR